MISDLDAERAIDFLRNSAQKAAMARAERAYIEEFRKTLKAQIMKERAGESIGAQERDAYADPRYIAHLDAIKAAVFNDEYQRFMRVAAEAKLAAWQTQSANTRGLGRIT